MGTVGLIQSDNSNLTPGSFEIDASMVQKDSTSPLTKQFNNAWSGIDNSDAAKRNVMNL